VKARALTAENAEKRGPSAKLLVAFLLGERQGLSRGERGELRNGDFYEEEPQSEGGRQKVRVEAEGGAVWRAGDGGSESEGHAQDYCFHIPRLGQCDVVQPGLGDNLLREFEYGK
jgi:hypothetical protein